MSSLDRSEGLVPYKYQVLKHVEGMDYEAVNDFFVLRPSVDPGAVSALEAYISWCMDNGKEQLAFDLQNWLEELGLVGW